MGELIKDLEIKNGQKDKFLTVDTRGVIKSSVYGKEDIDNMNQEITVLKNKTQQATEKVIDINGEQV